MIFSDHWEKNVMSLHKVIVVTICSVLHYTSVLMTRGLFPRVSKKCRGDSIVPNSWRSPNLSLSVSVVAEIPASGPRLGREPAVTEGSGICPGIASDSVVTTARRHREKTEDTQMATKPDQWKTHTALFTLRAMVHTLILYGVRVGNIHLTFTNWRQIDVLPLTYSQLNGTKEAFTQGAMLLSSWSCHELLVCYKSRILQLPFIRLFYYFTSEWIYYHLQRSWQEFTLFHLQRQKTDMNNSAQSRLKQIPLYSKGS